MRKILSMTYNMIMVLQRTHPPPSHTPVPFQLMFGRLTMFSLMCLTTPFVDTIPIRVGFIGHVNSHVLWREHGWLETSKLICYGWKMLGEVPCEHFESVSFLMGFKAMKVCQFETATMKSPTTKGSHFVKETCKNCVWFLQYIVKTMEDFTLWFFMIFSLGLHG